MMSREILPNRRVSESITITFQGERYDVTVGRYPDDRVGEVFITRIIGKSSSKISTLLDGVCRDSAILMSLAIQHGTSLETLRHAITRDEQENPATIVGAVIDHLLNHSIGDSNDTRHHMDK